MSETVASFDAQTHLPELLERLARGETITITEDGKPVVQLVPVPPAPKPDVRKAVQEMLDWRDQHGPTLGDDLTVRDLIEEGRR